MRHSRFSVCLILIGLMLTSPAALSASEWPAPYLLPAALESPAPDAAMPVVVVRFPLIVPPGDMAELARDYSDKMFVGGNSGAGISSELMPEVPGIMLTKSSVYGMLLGTCLKERSGGAFQVLLEPATAAQRSGRWDYTSAARPLPATVLIDFMAWTSPYSSMVRSSSFGNRLQPLISVRVPPQAAPQTKGMVLIDQSLFYIASDSSNGSVPDARSAAGAALPEFLNTRAQSSMLGFVSPWKKRTPVVPVEQLSKRQGYESGKVSGLPMLILDLKKGNPSGDPSIDVAQTCTALTHTVAKLLTEPSVGQAAAAQLSSYAQSLANLSQGSLTPERLTAHPQLLNNMLRGEVAFLQRQDDKLAATVLTEEFKKSFVAAKQAEASAAKKQGIMQWLAVGVMAAGTVAGAEGDLASMTTNSLIAQEMLTRADAGTGAAVSALSDIYSLFANFSIDVQVEGELIQATTHAEFRSKLLQVFQKKAE